MKDFIGKLERLYSVTLNLIKVKGGKVLWLISFAMY